MSGLKCLGFCEQRELKGNNFWENNSLKQAKIDSSLTDIYHPNKP